MHATPLLHAPMPGRSVGTTLCVSLLLAACAAYDGRGLSPGQSRLADVERLMGTPAMRWEEPDGRLRLAYPRGPMGFHTYIVELAADGRLLSIANVLDNTGFAGIRAGMDKGEVLHRLGPPDAGATQYFARRDELVWEWRYCDDYAMPARYSVLFDNGTGKVRSTMSRSETMSGWGDRATHCGR